MKWLLLGVVLSGCDGISVNATLADVPNPVLSIVLVPETDADDDDLIETTVELSVFPTPMQDTGVHPHGPDDCWTIADHPAMFDHTSIDIGDQGGYDDDDGCFSPHWTASLRLGPEDGTSITLPDGFGATFPSGLLGARIAHLTDGHPWSFHAGETFQITWSSTDDLATLAPVSLVASWKTGATSVPIKPVTFDATTITLQMPDPLPAGDGVFEVLLDVTLDYTPTTCTGAIRCQVKNSRRFDHTAHVD